MFFPKRRIFHSEIDFCIANRVVWCCSVSLSPPEVNKGFTQRNFHLWLCWGTLQALFSAADFTFDVYVTVTFAIDGNWTLFGISLAAVVIGYVMGCRLALSKKMNLFQNVISLFGCPQIAVLMTANRNVLAGGSFSFEDDIRDFKILEAMFESSIQVSLRTELSFKIIFKNLLE